MADLLDDFFRYDAGRHLQIEDLRRLAACEMSEEEERQAAYHLQECRECAALATEYAEQKEKTPKPAGSEVNPKKPNENAL